LTDKDLIKFLFDSEKIISSIDDEVYRILNSTGIVDLNKKSENFSYTDASSVFAVYFFEYLNSDNSAKAKKIDNKPLEISIVNSIHRTLQFLNNLD
jgi:hypothetical protein